jgi:hypothetical protein
VVCSFVGDGDVGGGGHGDGGHGDSWVTFAWTLWWIDSVVALIIAIGVPFVM